MEGKRTAALVVLFYGAMRPRRNGTEVFWFDRSVPNPAAIADDIGGQNRCEVMGSAHSGILAPIWNMRLVSENGWRQHPPRSPAAVTRLRSSFDLLDYSRSRALESPVRVVFGCRRH
jgi:hypothetical protein